MGQHGFNHGRCIKLQVPPPIRPGLGVVDAAWPAIRNGLPKVRLTMQRKPRNMLRYLSGDEPGRQADPRQVVRAAVIDLMGGGVH